MKVLIHSASGYMEVHRNITAISEADDGDRDHLILIPDDGSEPIKLKKDNIVEIKIQA